MNKMLSNKKIILIGAAAFILIIAVVVISKIQSEKKKREEFEQMTAYLLSESNLYGVWKFTEDNGATHNIVFYEGMNTNGRSSGNGSDTDRNSLMVRSDMWNGEPKSYIGYASQSFLNVDSSMNVDDVHLHMRTYNESNDFYFRSSVVSQVNESEYTDIEKYSNDKFPVYYETMINGEYTGHRIGSMERIKYWRMMENSSDGNPGTYGILGEILDRMINKIYDDTGEIPLMSEMTVQKYTGEGSIGKVDTEYLCEGYSFKELQYIYPDYQPIYYMPYGIIEGNAGFSTFNRMINYHFRVDCATNPYTWAIN